MTPLPASEVARLLQPNNAAVAFRNDPANARYFQRPAVQKVGGPSNYGNSLVSRGIIGNYGVRKDILGRVNQDALPYAQYANNVTRSLPITQAFAHYAQSKGTGDTNSVLTDMQQRGTTQYAPHYAGFGEWLPREQARRNATGMMSSTLGKIVSSLGPAIVTGGAGLPMLGRVAMGAGFGGVAGGPLGAVTGGLAAGAAPNIKLPGFRAAVSAPMQAAKSVLGQVAQPINFLRLGTSQGIGSAWPAPSKAAYQANLLRAIRR